MLNPELEYRRQMAKMFGESTWISDKEKYENVQVQEIPIGWTKNGELVCLPQEHRDEPVIIGCGSRGAGKSFLMHSILDRAFFYAKKNCLIVNDFANETFSWNFGSPSLTSVNRLDEIRTGLPLWHIFPSSANMPFIEKMKIKNKFKVSIPFEEIVNNAEAYFGWSYPRDKFLPYFKNLKDTFLRAKEKNEIFDIIDNEFSSDGDHTMFASMKIKLKAIMDQLFKSRISSISEKDSIKKIIANGKEENVIDALFSLKKPRIPCFMTGHLFVREEIAEKFFYWILMQRFNQKREKSEWIFIDEVNKISSTTNKTIADVALTEIAQRGRMKRLGLFVVTQNYSTMNTPLKQNKGYVFILKQNSVKERKALADDCGLSDYQENIIAGLKQHDVLCISQNQKFVVYQKNGEKYEVEDEPILMTSLPPLSWHQPPGKTLNIY